MTFFIGTLLVLSSLFLIALVLIQQGKGGGLAGAFGGQGGQSAFGTKAGDVFTRVTIITALVWIFFCMLAIKLIGKDSTAKWTPKNTAPAATTPPATPGAPGAPAAGTPAPVTTPASGSTPATTPAATTPTPMSATSATTPEASPPAATTPMAPETPEGK